jgi:hypothetical protein
MSYVQGTVAVVLVVAVLVLAIQKPRRRRRVVPVLDFRSPKFLLILALGEPMLTLRPSVV